VSVWIELLSREAALIVVLAALGSGFVAFLHVSPAGRLALAPVFGLAAGSALLTSAAFVLPTGRATWFVLLPAVAASLLVAGRRTRRPSARELLQIGVVVAGVALLLTLPLAMSHTTGPVAYEVSDSMYYAMQAEGIAHRTIPTDTWGPPWDLVNGSVPMRYAQGYVQIGFVATAAAVGHLLGLDGSDAQAPFMLALVIIAALGLFAAVREWAGRPTWAAVLAALLLAGPLMLALVIDGSQAALSGLALVVPIALVAQRLVAGPGRREVVLLAVLLAGLHTMYPLLVPTVAVAALGLIAMLVVRGGRHRVPVRALAAAVALAAVLSPVAFVRNLEFWNAIASRGLLDRAGQAGAPQYDLPFARLPGWLTQTHDFYALGTGALWPGLLAAAAVGALALFGAWRLRAAAVLLALPLAAVALALYTASADDCSYCVQRALLVIGPVTAALVGAGLAAWTAGRRGPVAAVAAGAVVVALVAGPAVELQRRATQAAVVDPDLRALSAALPHGGGPIFLEGFGQSIDGAFQFPAGYLLAREHTGVQLAVATETDDYAHLALLRPPRPVGPEFTPGYTRVATRLPGIATQRRTVTRHGAYALQERRGVLDVTVTSGVAADAADRDPRGRAWVQGPMTFWLSAAAAPRAAALALAFEGPFSAVSEPAGARVQRRTRTGFVLCVPVAGVEPMRRVTVVLDLPPRARPRPLGRYRPRARPARALRLRAMRAVPGACGQV
jgi:hypothetical protein